MKTVLQAEKFVTDAKGRRIAIVLDLNVYERLVDAAEELADIRAYDKAKPKIDAEIASGEFVTLSDYRKSRGRKTN